MTKPKTRKEGKGKWELDYLQSDSNVPSPFRKTKPKKKQSHFLVAKYEFLNVSALRDLTPKSLLRKCTEKNPEGRM